MGVDSNETNQAGAGNVISRALNTYLQPQTKYELNKLWKTKFITYLHSAYGHQIWQDGDLSGFYP